MSEVYFFLLAGDNNLEGKYTAVFEKINERFHQIDYILDEQSKELEGIHREITKMTSRDVDAK